MKINDFHSKSMLAKNGEDLIVIWKDIQFAYKVCLLEMDVLRYFLVKKKTKPKPFRH